MPYTKTLSLEKERERCIRVIQGCIPKDHWQVLLDDLEKLPYKGAKDYQVYAREVYETAWKIWAEDQKDYLEQARIVRIFRRLLLYGLGCSVI